MADGFSPSHLKTPWTAILAAQSGDPALVRACLETLCQRYREPVRRFLQARLHRPDGVPDDDADDLTQAFFFGLLEHPFLDKLDPTRGSFRLYLKTTLRHFVVDARRAADRHRPDGVLTRLSAGGDPDGVLDEGRREKGEPAAATTRRQPSSPENEFDRAWARTVIAEAVEALRQQCADRGRPHYFAVFERHLWRPDEHGRPSYRDTATALGITEKDVANHLYRAKGEFGALLRELIRQTVATEAEVEKELVDLRRHTDGGWS